MAHEQLPHPPHENPPAGNTPVVSHETPPGHTSHQDSEAAEVARVRERLVEEAEHSEENPANTTSHSSSEHHSDRGSHREGKKHTYTATPKEAMKNAWHWTKWAAGKSATLIGGFFAFLHYLGMLQIDFVSGKDGGGKKSGGGGGGHDAHGHGGGGHH